MSELESEIKQRLATYTDPYLGCDLVEAGAFIGVQEIEEQYPGLIDKAFPPMHDAHDYGRNT